MLTAIAFEGPGNKLCPLGSWDRADAGGGCWDGHTWWKRGEGCWWRRGAVGQIPQSAISWVWPPLLLLPMTIGKSESTQCFYCHILWPGHDRLIAPTLWGMNEGSLREAKWLVHIVTTLKLGSIWISESESLIQDPSQPSTDSRDVNFSISLLTLEKLIFTSSLNLTLQIWVLLKAFLWWGVGCRECVPHSPHFHRGRPPPHPQSEIDGRNMPATFHSSTVE